MRANFIFLQNGGSVEATRHREKKRNFPKKLNFTTWKCTSDQIFRAWNLVTSWSLNVLVNHGLKKCLSKSIIKVLINFGLLVNLRTTIGVASVCPRFGCQLTELSVQRKKEVAGCPLKVNWLNTVQNRGYIDGRNEPDCDTEPFHLKSQTIPLGTHLGVVCILTQF